MAMNLHPEREANLTLKDIPDHDIDEFLFTPDGDITSRLVFPPSGRNLNVNHFNLAGIIGIHLIDVTQLEFSEEKLILGVNFKCNL